MQASAKAGEISAVEKKEPFFFTSSQRKSSVGETITHAFLTLRAPFPKIDFRAQHHLNRKCRFMAEDVAETVRTFFYKTKALKKLLFFQLSNRGEKEWNRLKKRIFLIIAPESKLQRLMEKGKKELQSLEVTSDRAAPAALKSFRAVEEGLDKLFFSTTFLTGIGTVLGGAVDSLNLIKAIRMLRKGIDLTKKQKQPQKREQRARWNYGRSLVHTARKNIVRHGTSLAANAVSGMRAGAQFALLAAPATPALATVLQVGSIVAAPLTLCLAGYGAKENIDQIRRLTEQRTLLRAEYNRLQELKQKMGIKQFNQETESVENVTINLKEREEILCFALRQLGDLRINHLVSLVSNSLLIVGSVASLASLAAGPAAAVFGTIGIVSIAVGAGGLFLTRSILVALRRRRLVRAQKKEFAPRYLSSKEMLAKAKEILSTDRENHVSYWSENRPVKIWSNGELFTYLLRSGSRQLNFNETRDAFLVGQRHFWKKTFG